MYITNTNEHQADWRLLDKFKVFDMIDSARKKKFYFYKVPLKPEICENSGSDIQGAYTGDLYATEELYH
jgi:hypothetical protein